MSVLPFLAAAMAAGLWAWGGEMDEVEDGAGQGEWFEVAMAGLLLVAALLGRGEAS